ncbi:unnamed protein product [Dibothriocephalus latus]|uniref:Uncharacterized protein n=1 Tax=Dibothriocephalus latus TaxID=60516 RepID=A0A3P7LJ21_DIBLA|nr:unnamed protein product [Dibothriocephalus latus]
MATRLVVSPRFLSLRLLLLFMAIMVNMIPAIQQQQQQQQSDLNNQSGKKNTEETLFRLKRQISKRQFTVGAVFETTARGSSEYQAFMNFPSSASLLWQNFRIKQRIVHVEDLKNSFQVASASKFTFND